MSDPTTTAADRYLHGVYHPNGQCPNGVCAEPTTRFADVNDPNEGIVAFLQSRPGDPAGHTWREVSGFAGRFCGWCGVDEDDYDDPRREGGCEAS